MNQMSDHAWRKVTMSLMVAAAISGCSKKPGGQVVAVVNNQEITQTELRAQASADNVPASANFDAIAPQLLDRVVQRNLLADFAREQGLDQGPEYVARRRQLEQTLLASLALQKMMGTPPEPSAAAVKQYIANNPTSFVNRERLSLDQLRFAAPKDIKIVRDAASLPTIDAIQARLRENGITVARGPASVDTGTIPTEVAKQISRLPTGAIFDLTADGTTLISAISARTPVATDQSKWPQIARSALQRELVAKKLSTKLTELKKKADIKYDEGYQPKAAAK